MIMSMYGGGALSTLWNDGGGGGGGGGGSREFPASGLNHFVIGSFIVFVFVHSILTERTSISLSRIRSWRWPNMRTTTSMP